MGDFNPSHSGSWKKMVISKSNDEWISTIRSVKEGDLPSLEIKTLLNIKIEKDDDDEETVNQDYEEEALGPDEDPLLEVRKITRRNGSGSKHESQNERASRLAKMSAYSAQRLANESPEQRAARLKRMSDYASRRLAQESEDQRARRLARMSAYAAKRLANETPEQRTARLSRMSAYAARRQAMKKFANSTLTDVDTNT